MFESVDTEKDRGLSPKMGKYSTPLLGFMLLCCLSFVTEAKYLKYKDPKQPLGARIRDLMSRMTLAEKIGQMVQIERSVATADVMKKYYIGMKSTIVSMIFSNECVFIKQCKWGLVQGVC